MSLQTLTSADLSLYWNHVWRPSWIEIHWNSIWLRVKSLHLRVRDHTTWCSRCSGQHWTLCFGLSQCNGHDSWLVCEVAIRTWSHVSPSHLRSIHATRAVECMEVEPYNFTWDPKSLVISPKNDMEAYMTTLFGGLLRDLGSELGQWVGYI